jgi:hypothetical protein
MDNYKISIDRNNNLISLIYWDGDGALPVPKDLNDPMKGFEGNVLKTAIKIEGSVKESIDSLLEMIKNHILE